MHDVNGHCAHLAERTTGMKSGVNNITTPSLNGRRRTVQEGVIRRRSIAGRPIRALSHWYMGKMQERRPDRGGRGGGGRGGRGGGGGGDGDGAGGVRLVRREDGRKKTRQRWRRSRRRRKTRRRRRCRRCRK